MTRMIRIVLPSALALIGMGCGDSTTTDMGGKADYSMNQDGTASLPDMSMQLPPPAPTLGAQIERMGRATINVAVTDPFDLTNAGRDATRDAYNKDGDPTKWAANWKADLQTMLAIYDGADATCGNQLAACGMLTGCPNGAAPTADRYALLATVLADDRIYLDTSKSSCKIYLAVEASVLGLANPECGGRTPGHQVVHEMYTAATVGASGFTDPTGVFAVTDGVPTDGDAVPVSLTDFPFLGDPM